MGVLPLQLRPGDSAASLGITGGESFSIRGLAQGVLPRSELTVEAIREDGSSFAFPVLARIDGPADARVYSSGGILQMVLRRMVSEAPDAS
jgi:aconitate hydratase